MRDAWAYFTINTALRPDDSHNTRLFRYLNPRMVTSHVSKEGVTSKIPQEEEEEEVRERRVLSRERRRKEELRLPEMKVLRYPEIPSSRQCARAALGRDVYRYVSSYLAGITKADRYNKFLSFQKEVLAKEGIPKSDFTASKVAENHEKKLKEVSRVGLCCGALNMGPKFRDLHGPRLNLSTSVTCPGRMQQIYWCPPPPAPSTVDKN